MSEYGRSRWYGAVCAVVLVEGLLAGCTGSPGDTTVSEVNSSSPAELPTTNDTLDDSVVFLIIETTGYVLYPTKSGDSKWSDKVVATSQCSGWFASSSGDIVTAGHCVDPAVARENVIETFLRSNDAYTPQLFTKAVKDWRVEARTEGTPPQTVVKVAQPQFSGHVIDAPFVVQIVDFQPWAHGDVALLKANGLSKETPFLKVADHAPDTGTELTAIGYPGAVGDVVDPSRLPNPSFKTGTASSQQVTTNGVAGTEMSAPTSPGMSGGPAVDKHGKVLGVISFGAAGSTQSFNFITDAKDLRRFLVKNDVISN